MSISGEEVRVGVGGVDWGGQSGGCRQVACCLLLLLTSTASRTNQSFKKHQSLFRHGWSPYQVGYHLHCNLQDLSWVVLMMLNRFRGLSGLVWLTIKKLSTSRRFSLFWTCGFRPECLFSSSLAIFNKSLKVSEKFQSKSRRTGSINEIQSSSSTPVWSDTQWLILIESSIRCCEIIIR